MALGVSHTGPATFGGQPVPGNANLAGALLVLNAGTGAVEWVRTILDTGGSYFGQPTADAAGNLYVAGSFGGAGTLSGSPTPLTSAGSNDAVVVSYSPLGAVRWVQQSGGTGTEFANGLVLAATGHLTVQAYALGQAQFGAATLVSPTGNFSPYVAQLAALPLAVREARLPAAPLTLCPNPAHAAVTLPALPSGTQVAVVDALGRTALTITLKNAQPIALTGLAPGLYQVVATAADGQHWAGRLAVE